MDQMSHHVGAAGNTALIFLLGFLPAATACCYVIVAMRKRKHRLLPWSRWRTASFIAGTLLIIAAISPPFTAWAHQDLRGHMLQHLFLGMFGPLGLVFGAPGTLLISTIRASAARRLMHLLRSPPVRILIHPVTAALLEIGGMYLLYLTPLYSVSMSHPIYFVLVHLHFVISGYLFTWSVAGPDPAPHRPGRGVRLTVLFLATAAHAVLGKMMYGYGYPQGTAASLSEIHSAAQWMYYGGDLAELLIMVGFFSAWFRHRSALPLAFAAKGPLSGDPR